MFSMMLLVRGPFSSTVVFFTCVVFEKLKKKNFSEFFFFEVIS